MQPNAKKSAVLDIAASVLMKRADLDGNGVLDYDEFERLITVLVATSMIAPLSHWVLRDHHDELQVRNEYSH